MTIKHGVYITEVSTGARAISTVSLAIIGLIATAADADAVAFPLNTPVLITDVRASIAKAGEAGTLAASLDAIADQCNPLAVVIRVAPGVDAAAQAANAVAACAIMETAESVCGVRPRILGAPGIDAPTVAAALVATAAKLRAFAYISTNGAASIEDAVEYAEDYADREVMVIHGDFKSGADTISAVAVALGTRARLDNEQGVQKSLSNVPVRGVTGVSVPVSFDMQSMATDAGVLNAANVTAIVHAGGFRFWGNRTRSDDPLFAFEPTVRIAQLMRDTVAEGVAWSLDKPLHPSLARDILGTINGKFAELVRQGVILGGEAWIDPAANTTTTLSGGKLYIDYDYTAPPPLEDLELNQRITDRYLADFAAQVSAG